MLLWCNNLNIWAQLSPCTSKSCTNGVCAGAPAPAAPACTVTLNNDGGCSAGKYCVSQSGTATCVNFNSSAACRPTNPTGSCQNSVSNCTGIHGPHDASGDAYCSVTSKNTYEVCCAAFVCNSGAAQCDSKTNTTQSCVNGQWQNEIACKTGYTCIAPPGGAVCQQNTTCTVTACKATSGTCGAGQYNACPNGSFGAGKPTACFISSINCPKPPTGTATCAVTWGSLPANLTPNTSYTIPVTKVSASNAWEYVSVYKDSSTTREGGLANGTPYQFTFNSGAAGTHTLKFYNNDFVGYGKTSGSGPKTLCTPTQTFTSGPACTPVTGACQQIDANHCGNVGRQPTTCGLTTTWSSCTITPQACEAPNTCNTSTGICVPPTPTAPILGTGTCTGTIANLSWTIGTGSASTNAYYCDQTKAAAGGCKPDDATVNRSRWFLLVNGGNNKSPLSVTGLTLGDTYQWLVAGITGATHINSSIGTFTCSTTPPVCTLPKFYPHFACQINTCVPVATCDNNDPGCTAAGGSCGTQPGDTVLSFVIGLDGIGTTGDNVNPAFTSGTNTAIINGVAVTNNFPGSTQDPVHKDLDLTVLLLDSSGSPVTVPSAKVDYDTTKSDANYGKFLGTLDLGTSFTTGDYTVKVTVDGHLRRTIQATQGLGTIQTITAGQTKTLSARLVAGDVDSDNALTIKDYNILMSCMPDVSPDGGAACGLNANYATRSHLLDNSTISSLDDYDLFLREYSVQNGD